MFSVGRCSDKVLLAVALSVDARFSNCSPQTFAHDIRQLFDECLD
jgi:hypothetical protein